MTATESAIFNIKQGLEIPLTGFPRQTASFGPEINQVGVVGDDYVGMKPTMAVAEGDSVKLGELLFTDKRTPGVKYTSPGCGKVVAVNRGAKRKFESVVIDLNGEDQVEFPTYDVSGLTSAQAVENLVDSGLWTALRTRPFSRVPAPESVPHSIFVTAIDTNPLAANPTVTIDENREDFILGLHVLRRLTEGRIYVCCAPDADVPGNEVDGIEFARFAGPHPAGLVGTHIHFLDPVNNSKTVWHIGYQDVIAFGHLFRTGRIRTERVISLAGPVVQNPRLVRTRTGANLEELVADELRNVEHRLISGSVLSGRQSEPHKNFLGRYDLQLSVLAEGRQREFMGWQMPGFNKFSITRSFAAFWLRHGKRMPLNTSTGGSPRAMVPIGSYEKVMPLDILPTFLLRALIVRDTEQAQALGCLELDEEDLGLCTFVCPGKYDYGPILRDNLTQIELEG